MTRFSLKRDNQSTKDNPTAYMLFSDRVRDVFPGYVVDDRCRMRPGPETLTVDFLNLKELLLSNDLARDSELDWISNKNLRFLDGTDMQG